MANPFSKEAELLASWQLDSKKFVIEALGIERISVQQVHALDELSFLVTSKIKAAAKLRLTERESQCSKKLGISVMSGKGTGKDAWTAWAIIWFLCCFPHPKIGCTAPTAHQLRDVLWSEISKWLNTPKCLVRNWLTWQAEKIFITEEEGKRSFAVARTTNLKGTAEQQAETLAGLHEEYLMLVVDEAQGIPEPVYREVEGSMTGNCNFSIVIFNPSRMNCYATKTQFQDRGRWMALRWNAEDSELVSRDSIEQKAKKYGKDSAYYAWSVLGLPPRADEHVLIPNDWVMEAIDRDVEPLDTDVEVFGADVGAGGDESVLIRRHGPKVLEIQVTNTAHSEELTGWIMRRIFDYEPQMVFIDPIGIGWGIAGNLRARTKTPIYDVNVAEIPSDDSRYFRLRDELWWNLREQFEHGTISIPDDALLIAELTSIRFEEPDGKIKVESKREMKKRGVESPNRADALCLTEYFGPTTIRKMRQQKRKNKHLEVGSWRTV